MPKPREYSTHFGRYSHHSIFPIQHKLLTNKIPYSMCLNVRIRIIYKLLLETEVIGLKKAIHEELLFFEENGSF